MTNSVSVERLVETTLDPAVDGFLHHPAGKPDQAIVLTHGAGSDCNAAILIGVAEAFADSGWLALRCNLPFRQRRRRVPPGPGDAARDREGLRSAVQVMRNLGVTRVFLGGHSYGGRQASMLAASDPDLVSGLLLLSYPLHPPRKPEQLRTQHFPRLNTRTFFVHGTRDPFGSVLELEQVTKLIPARTTLLRVEVAGHDLLGKEKSAHSIQPSEIVASFLRFLAKP